MKKILLSLALIATIGAKAQSDACLVWNEINPIPSAGSIVSVNTGLRLYINDRDFVHYSYSSLNLHPGIKIHIIQVDGLYIPVTPVKTDSEYEETFYIFKSLLKADNGKIFKRKYFT